MRFSSLPSNLRNWPVPTSGLRVDLIEVDHVTFTSRVDGFCTPDDVPHCLVSHHHEDRHVPILKMPSHKRREIDLVSSASTPAVFDSWCYDATDAKVASTSWQDTIKYRSSMECDTSGRLIEDWPQGYHGAGVIWSDFVSIARYRVSKGCRQVRHVAYQFACAKDVTEGT